MARTNYITIPTYNRKLPLWANGIIAVGSVALVGFVAYVIYKSVQKKSEQKDERKTVDQAKDDLKNWSKSGGKLTYANNLSVYNSTANTIAKLLDGCETVDTEIEVIKNVIHCCKNQGDWLKLCEVFGVRNIDNCGWMTGDTQYSLPDLLKDQLDTFYTLSPVGTYEGFKFPVNALNTADVLNTYFKSKNIQW